MNQHGDTMAHATRRQRGFTLIEMLFVLAMASVLLGIMIPRMRVSPTRKVKLAAQQLVRDLEVARTRALSTKKGALMVFDISGNAYVGYLDDNRDGTFDQSAAESRALRARGRVELSRGVQFGRGTATPVPGDAGAGPVTFAANQVQFSARGVTTPFGTRGTIYLVHRDHAEAVSAVTVSGAGSFQLLSYVGGAWR